MTTTTVSNIPDGKYLLEQVRMINQGSGTLVFHDDDSGNIRLAADVSLANGEVVEFTWNGTAWVDISNQTAMLKGTLLIPAGQVTETQPYNSGALYIPGLAMGDKVFVTFPNSTGGLGFLPTNCEVGENAAPFPPFAQIPLVYIYIYQPDGFSGSDTPVEEQLVQYFVLRA